MLFPCYFYHNRSRSLQFFKMLFNRDLNCDYLVGLHVFFAFFRESVFDKFTAAIFVRKILRNLQSFHFVFKIFISKMHNLCSRLLFH